MRRIENGDIINKDGYKVGSYSDSKNVATSGYFQCNNYNLIN